jgi:hypothetical protein
MKMIAILALAVITTTPPNTLAKDAPGSKNELVKRLEQAVRAKDKNAALELFCWDGVSGESKKRQEAPIQMLFDEREQGLELSSVKAGSLPASFPVEQVIDGVRYRPNLPVLGVVRVMLAGDNNPTEFVFTYGKKDNAFFLLALVEAESSNKTDSRK